MIVLNGVRVNREEEEKVKVFCPFLQINKTFILSH